MKGSYSPMVGVNIQGICGNAHVCTVLGPKIYSSQTGACE